MNLKIDTPYFYFEIIKDNIPQIHHLYFGIILFYFGYSYDIFWMSVIGFLLFIDDWAQHVLQGTDKSIRSPLHQLTLLFEPLRKAIYLLTGWEWVNKI